MALSPQEPTLFEQKYAEMVPPRGGKHIVRTAHFLKPSFGPTLYESPPNVTPTKPVSALTKFYPRLRFNGWRGAPAKSWNSWFERMRRLHEETWRKASIYDAIMASKLEIPKCYESLLALAEKWCSETNSFVMQWGEASITLEDVMVLGCYSVTGESVGTELLSKEMLAIEEKLLARRSKLCRTKHKKPTQQQWIESWMDQKSEIEHEAFLSYWLSRYVMPADDMSTINKSVFPLAVLLAKGVKLALAPAVLASIYRDLGLLKKTIETLRDSGDSDFEGVKSVTLWAPLQLFQAWIWERFPKLSPIPSFITDGLRLKRWNKVKVVKNESLAEVVDSGADFVWRPYSTPVNNWSFRPNLYPDIGEWVCVGDVVCFDIESYVRCVRTSELVGLESDCVKKYLPHRVSMQFGFDQDIPLAFPRLSDSETVCWKDYNRPIGDVKLYVPSRFFGSDVTVEYLEWWKKSKSTGTLRIEKEMREVDAPPGFVPNGKRAALNDLSDSPLSKRSKGSPPPVKSGNKEVIVPPLSTPDVEGVEANDDSDDDDDHLTLSQFFQFKSCKQAKNSSCPVIESDSPLPSPGDGYSSQEDINNAGATGDIGCTRTEISLKDGTGIDSESPTQRPTDSKTREARPKIGVSECPKMKLSDRIARMQRIVDMLKVTNHA